MNMDLYFLRHGKTLYNKRDIFQGLSDSPLLKEGRVLAEKMGQYFQDKDIDLIYSSPLKRARETTKIINKYLKKKVIFDDRLKEICYGDFEEKRREDLKKLPIWEQRERNKFEFVHPGFYQNVSGQSYRKKYENLKDFFEELLGFKKNVVVVGHTGICMAAQNYFNSNSRESPSYIKQKNDEIYSVRYLDEREYQGEIVEV